ncbi:tubulin-folding cofactor A-like isoform X3 [Papaver somniferum]|uniref:tubulin-folding cofactor A-like isoform X3 n=1 Tax=Papaver somniferum TaxID=3469 RepID=UPI000E6FC5A6|nr:tubulin-folding cofactor A-like isoform X3 [Papaver somniferum]
MTISFSLLLIRSPRGKILKNFSVIMATLRNLKIKTGTCKRVLKELYSYEKEVEREASKTADMKEKGADPYDLKQQENVLAESRMMIPDCHKRLETSLADIKETLAQLEKSNQQDGPELDEARKIIDEVEILFKTSEA